MQASPVILTQPFVPHPVTMSANSATTPEIQIAVPFRGLDIMLPAVWESADIGVLVSPVAGAGPFPLYDAAGSRVTWSGLLTTSAGIYAGPSELWVLGACYSFVLQSLNTSSGGAKNQTSARELLLIPKA